MKKISDIYGIVKECRERIIKTMQERGIKELATCMSYAEWCKENKCEPEEDEDDDTDYQDYKDQDCPYCVFLGKYDMNDYRIDKVTLEGDRFKFEGFCNELGYDWQWEGDTVWATRMFVWERLAELLGIEDEEEKLVVLCSYDSDEQEFDDHLIVSKKVFYSKDGKKKIRKYLNEAFEYENMYDDDRKEFRECVKDLLKGKVGYFGIKYFWEETTAIL